MRFSLATIVVGLPSLVEASPTTQAPATKIPFQKRGMLNHASVRMSVASPTTRRTSERITGKAYQSISSFGASPVFNTIVSDVQVDAAVFAFKLTKEGAELTIDGTAISWSSKRQRASEASLFCCK
ncbi:hypothetical protein CONPUDRAFT_154562 [Coniophora puteana RWD-64-598 SS2]|uniref:Uncharacterized protein n=1 Tax=Coniophora puteana (strain RWD-64-598) TaxID=741705 RepID=A0A5M3MP75_CONPW|nr:uncharacterized protein CONPUDRAFT_154562 [Coniophora puteana RWD-64-598 SS2]EIW80534.1 hypothetical protein CONPUDRAFT_154562 [Coniophora puteana RWD-64-598 SS2]